MLQTKLACSAVKMRQCIVCWLLGKDTCPNLMRGAVVCIGDDLKATKIINRLFVAIAKLYSLEKSRMLFHTKFA